MNEMTESVKWCEVVKSLGFSIFFDVSDADGCVSLRQLAQQLAQLA